MDDLKQKYLTLVAAASDEAAIEDLRVQALGKRERFHCKCANWAR